LTPIFRLNRLVNRGLCDLGFRVLHVTCACFAKTDSFGNGLLTDIVLKDQLIVYDNDQLRVGWKPFDCKHLSLFRCCHRDFVVVTF